MLEVLLPQCFRAAQRFDIECARAEFGLPLRERSGVAELHGCLPPSAQLLGTSDAGTRQESRLLSRGSARRRAREEAPEHDGVSSCADRPRRGGAGRRLEHDLPRRRARRSNRRRITRTRLLRSSRTGRMRLRDRAGRVHFGRLCGSSKTQRIASSTIASIGRLTGSSGCGGRKLASIWNELINHLTGAEHALAVDGTRADHVCYFVAYAENSTRSTYPDTSSPKSLGRSSWRPCCLSPRAQRRLRSRTRGIRGHCFSEHSPGGYNLLFPSLHWARGPPIRGLRWVSPVLRSDCSHHLPLMHADP